MIKATVKGDYDGRMRLALMAGAVVYLVSPLDLVPELVLLAVGLIDDAVVVTWLAGAVLSETERFLDWERQRAKVIESARTERAPASGGPQSRTKESR
jgi:uncharacterized membrane protein YkvA (DUF1232 family)